MTLPPRTYPSGTDGRNRVKIGCKSGPGRGVQLVGAGGVGPGWEGHCGSSGKS